jgi:hypothetical protein
VFLYIYNSNWTNNGAATFTYPSAVVVVVVMAGQ